MSITIGQYKGIEVTVPSLKIGEAEVEEQLQGLLAQSTVKSPVDGPVEMGHTVVMDFEGFKDDVPFDGGKANGYELKIGSHSFIPGFEEQMVGMAKGETRDLHLSFPENYHAAHLAGAEVVFKVTVHEIQEDVPAVLNDDFAKSFCTPGIETVQNLRDYIQTKLTEQAKIQIGELAEQQVMTKLIKSVEGELPAEKVEKILTAQVNQIRANMAREGIQLEQYLEMSSMTMEDLRAQLVDTAKEQLKLECALKEIADRENISATEEEIEDHYVHLAQTCQMEVEEVKGIIAQSAVEIDIRCKKASEFVVSEAKITFED